MKTKTYNKKELYNNTSIIHIDINYKYVIKEVVCDEWYELVERELYWLNVLKNTNFAPKILDVAGNKIKMSYCGDILSNNNKPKDLMEQLFNINIELLKHHCYYNDWKKGNVLVLNTTVYLIDYGWCPLIKEDYTCGNTIKTNRINKKSGNYFMNIL